MQTVTLNIDDSIFDKFRWLVSHFSNHEISIVNEIEYLMNKWINSNKFPQIIKMEIKMILGNM